MILFTRMKSGLNRSGLQRVMLTCGVALLAVSTPVAAQFTQPLFIPDTLSTADNDTIFLKAEETQRIFFPGATTEVE